MWSVYIPVFEWHCLINAEYVKLLIFYLTLISWKELPDFTIKLLTNYGNFEDKKYCHTYYYSLLRFVHYIQFPSHFIPRYILCGYKISYILILVHPKIRSVLHLRLHGYISPSPNTNPNPNPPLNLPNPTPTSLKWRIHKIMCSSHPPLIGWRASGQRGIPGKVGQQAGREQSSH